MHVCALCKRTHTRQRRSVCICGEVQAIGMCVQGDGKGGQIYESVKQPVSGGHFSLFLFSSCGPVCSGEFVNVCARVGD